MPPLMTASDVAARFGCSTRTVNRMAHDRVLPALKRGRHWRFTEAAVSAYEAANTTQPAAPVRTIGYREPVVPEIVASWDAPRNPVFPEAWALTADEAASPAAGSGRTARTEKAASVSS